MRPVEQAVFTSVETGHRGNYLIVARSAGIDEADLRELAAWGPAGDSLLSSSPDSASLNFHPLPSGAYSVARTIAVGWTDNGQAERVYTQSLIVPRDTLAAFGNNPFAVIDAAAARGAWQVLDPPYPPLAPLDLGGGAAPVDQPLLCRLAADPGPQHMGILVQAVRDAACLAIASSRPAADVIAGLMSCLPPECRPEFSFSTGLRFTPRRPFHIVALPDDPAEQSWVAHHHNVTALCLRKDGVADPTPMDAWAHLIQRALAGGHVSFLAAQLAKRRFHLTLQELPALGMQLLEELDDCSGHVPGPSEYPSEAGASPTRTAHAAHRPPAGGGRATAATRPAGCSMGLAPDSPGVLEKLEQLDDLVYEAIQGAEGAMEQLQVAWPRLLQELDRDLLAESREQYLRYALSVWQQCVEPDGIRHPSLAIRATEVLCLLFADVA